MRTLQVVVLVTMVSALGACASSSTSSSSQNKSGTITLEEIEQAGRAFSNAHEIVRQFRPQWLIKRGTANIGGSSRTYDFVVIYVDNIRQGDPETLRSISAQSVQQIEHFNTAQAQRLGPVGHPHGAIVVRTKSR